MDPVESEELLQVARQHDIHLKVRRHHSSPLVYGASIHNVKGCAYKLENGTVEQMYQSQFISKTNTIVLLAQVHCKEFVVVLTIETNNPSACKVTVGRESTSSDLELMN